MSEPGAGSPVENSSSAVAGDPRRALTLGQKLGLGTLLAVVALGVIWFNALLRNKSQPPQKPVVTVAARGVDYTPPPADKPSSDALPLPAANATSADMKTEASPPPILAYSGGGIAGISRPGSATMPAEADSRTLDTTPAGSTAPLAPQSNLGALLKPTTLNGATASVIKNPDMVITQGTLMPCILQTAIDSDLPGEVTCIVPVDVRGTTGNVVLLDRGTRIVGQYENGLMQGHARLFVLWTRAETPNHVVIALNAPAADELGRSGLGGPIDNHFWKRFGSALMFTVLQGGLNAGTMLAANSGSSSNNGAALGFVYGAQSNGSQLANTALQHDINTPDTLPKNQGDTVSVIIAQDLNFSQVYRLKLTDHSDGP